MLFHSHRWINITVFSTFVWIGWGMVCVCVCVMDWNGDMHFNTLCCRFQYLFDVRLKHEYFLDHVFHSRFFFIILHSLNCLRQTEQIARNLQFARFIEFNAMD